MLSLVAAICLGCWPEDPFPDPPPPPPPDCTRPDNAPRSASVKSVAIISRTRINIVYDTGPCAKTVSFSVNSPFAGVAQGPTTHAGVVGDFSVDVNPTSLAANENYLAALIFPDVGNNYPATATVARNRTTAEELDVMSGQVIYQVSAGIVSPILLFNHWLYENYEVTYGGWVGGFARRIWSDDAVSTIDGQIPIEAPGEIGVWLEHHWLQNAARGVHRHIEMSPFSGVTVGPAPGPRTVFDARKVTNNFLYNVGETAAGAAHTANLQLRDSGGLYQTYIPGLFLFGIPLPGVLNPGVEAALEY